MEVYQRNQQKVAQCYFCGEEMSPSQLEMHVKTCGCVLEPCPENCGLYVQRQYKNHHSSWCKKDPSKQPYVQNLRADLEGMRDQLEQEMIRRRQQMESYVEQMEKYNQKMARTEELNMKLIDAVTGIRKLVNDEQCARLKDILEVKTSVSEASKVIMQLKFTVNQTRVDVEELRNDLHTNEQYEKMYEQFQEWKRKQDEVVSGMRVALDKNVHAEINKLHNDNVIRSKSVNDLLDLNEVIIDTQDKYTEQIYQLEVDLKEFKKFLAEENIMISGIWREQLEEIKSLKVKFEQIEAAIQSLSEEQKTIKEKINHMENFSKDLNNLNTGSEKLKLSETAINEELVKELIEERNEFRKRLEDLEVLNKPNERSFSTDTSLSIFDDTIVKQQNEIAQRLETLEKLTTEVHNCGKRSSTSTNNEPNDLPVIVNELTSEQSIIKRRLESLEALTQELEEVKYKLSSNKLPNLGPAASINGRIMWTISNFGNKLEETKETRTQIESQCFYTSESGYKLQLRAYLNGIGQWEGRHMIVSLHVLPTQWDSRLVWPCRLKVIFCLRDQDPIHRKAKDLVKSFTSNPAAKGFESACLQMFIPHRTLYTKSYLKNDVIIIDVRAHPL
uniref:MATH domain-containing protein n=1 Tax=Graphocephala atropunctata TaxID=36148 RepID=A0A1B6L8J9_9HEMI